MESDSEESTVTSTVTKANVPNKVPTPHQPNLTHANLLDLTQVEQDEKDLTEKIKDMEIIQEILQEIIVDLEKEEASSTRSVQQTNTRSQQQRQRNEIFDFNRAMFNAENVNNHFNITRIDAAASVEN